MVGSTGCEEVGANKKGLIERRFTFLPQNFTIFKEFQRYQEGLLGMKLTNSQALAVMLNTVKRGLVD